MKRKFIANLILTVAISFMAFLFVNVHNVFAAEEKNEYAYSETNGNLVFELNTIYFQENKSSLMLNVKAYSTSAEESFTSFKICSTNTPICTPVSVEESQVINDVSHLVNIVYPGENSVTFTYTTTTVTELTDFVIDLKLDKYGPLITRSDADNKTAKQKVAATLEVEENKGIRTLSYVLVPTGESTLGKDWTNIDIKYSTEYTHILSLDFEAPEDGIYDLYVKVYDYAGLESVYMNGEDEVTGEYFVGTYTVDTQAPVFNGEIGVDAEWTKVKEVVLPIANEGVMTYQLNGAAPVEYTKDTNTITIEVNGESTIKIHAIDAAGNESEKEAVAKIDNLAPEVSLVVTEADILTGEKVKFETSATDEHTSVDKIYYKVNEEEFVEYTGLVELPIVEGTYTIEVYAVDTLGNESEHKTHTTNNITSLTVDINELTEGKTEWTPLDVELRFEVISALGIQKVEIYNKLDDTTKTELTTSDTVYTYSVSENGTYIVDVTTVDGVVTSEELVVGNIDKEAPELGSSTILTSKNEFTMNFEYKDNLSGIDLIGVLICDPNEVDCVFSKEVNPGEEFLPVFEKMIFVKNDLSTIPEGAIPEDWSDKFTLIDLKDFTGTFNWTVADGEWVVKVEVMDAAFNVASLPDQHIFSDGTAPTIAVIEKVEEGNVTKETFTFNVTSVGEDLGSGILEEYINVYKFDENGEKVLVNEYDMTVTQFEITEEGKYEVYYYIKDNSGNFAEWVEVVTIDRTAPNIGLEFNVEPGVWTNALEMTIKSLEAADASALSTLKYSYALENGEFGEFVEVEDFGKVTLNLGTGKYKFKVVAIDQVGNEKEVTSDVMFVDATKPIVITETSLDDLVIGKDLDITFELIDTHSGISKFSYKIYRNGEEAGESVEATASAKTTIALTSAAEGVYKVVVTLIDKVGNICEEETEEFIVDLNAPIIKGLNATGYHTNGITLTIEDMSDVVVSLNGVESNEKTLEVTENGNYQLIVTDQLGRTSTKLFIVNQQNKLVLKDKTIDVLTQRYLPVVKNGDKFYVNLLPGDYGLKDVLVLTTQKDGFQARLDQKDNYLYLKKNVNDTVKKNGYKFEIKDSSLIEKTDELGYYGYVVASVVTVDEALELDIEVVVIDNEGLALGLGVAGTIALVGLFFVSRSKKTLKV